MQIIQSKLLNRFKNLTHCFTTKDVGNLAFHVDDNPINVIKRHKTLAYKLHYDFKKLVHMKQIHSDIVHIINDNDNFENPPICDALITNKINIPLMVMVADCSPILFYDCKLQVIAVAHAGRQGAFKNIIKNVVASLKNNYNSNVKDIYVSIGASIGVCCYEVGDEIFSQTKNMGLDYAIQKKNNKYYLNIRKILISQLLASDIRKSNIEISDECSCCKADKYFSYRAKNKTGRFTGLMMLN